LVPLAPRKLFNFNKRVKWNLMMLQKLLLLLKPSKKQLMLKLNLLRPRKRLMILKLKELQISHMRMLLFKQRKAQRKTVWLFLLKLSRNQKVPIKLKNFKLWKKLLRKLLKKPINKEWI
jgi:hypothetical protein